MACDKDVRECLTKIFNECDKDKSGCIDAKEVEAALKRCNQSPDCKNKWNDAKIKEETALFLKQADKNNDSKVSCKEFVDFYAARMK
jgi:Ca2+-binding EF-hand superfamily protein